jgi:hypothetical protein
VIPQGWSICPEDLAKQVRNALPEVHGPSFSPGDALALSQALSGSPFAITALMAYVFPGRNARSPGMVIGQLAVRRYIATYMADLWVKVTTMPIP